MGNSKCYGENCTLKDKCLRYTSKPKAFCQSYTDFAQDEVGKCEYFKSNEIVNK